MTYEKRNAMVYSRRQLLGVSGGLLIAGGYSSAWAAQVVAVRLWPSPQYTRLAIESDVRLVYRHQYQTTPLQLSLEIDDLTLAPPLTDLGAKVFPEDPYVSSIQVSALEAGAVKITIAFKQAVAPQIFALTPIAPYAHRLVVDLAGLRSADPLGDLITTRLSQKPVLPPDLTPPPKASSTPAPAASAPAASVPTPTPTTSRPTASSVDRPLPENKPAAGDIQPGYEPKTVMIAIDPGHGGEDPGAIGPGGTREKDVVLAIAQKLSERLRQTKVPGLRFKTFLTRDGDYFVPLHLRVQKAQRVNADLMISVHADAFTEPTARGASVFALSQGGATSAAARWMAEKENKADLVGGINLKAKDPTIQRVFLDMSTSAQIRDSVKIGNMVLKQVGRFAKLHKPSVEQAGFAVLKAPDVPSILVETAFISNPEEEILLRDGDFQDRIADALVGGVTDYFLSVSPKSRLR